MLQDRVAMLVGIGMGAGLMFFLDPAQGRRRRALVRDKLVRAGHVTRDTAATARRDMANRATGVAARLRRTTDDRPTGDRVLVERVRALLGHVVSHPRAIDVTADDDGVVTLRGQVLEHEFDQLCRAVEGVPGVREVINELELYSDPTNVPSLQGDGGLRRLWQGSSPTTRVVTAVLATAGAGLVARAVSGQGTRMQMH
jgi:hypothetical protein